MHTYITSDDGPTFNRVFIYTLLHRQMHAVFINIECIHTYTYLRTDLRTDEARVLFTYPFYPDISFVSNCNQSITAFNPIRTDTLLELHSLKYTYTYLHTYIRTSLGAAQLVDGKGRARAHHLLLRVVRAAGQYQLPHRDVQI